MKSYFHSVTLDEERCLGCTNCIKHCPTEAIRVHNGKATIIAERCIDCGECIRICPYHAKLAITDPLENIKKYKYPIALPAPTLYGQFRNNISVDQVIRGLLDLGFYKVWEVARGAEIVSAVTEIYLENHSLQTPVISSACPAIVRLLQVKYPELVDSILPVQSPMDVSAYLVKEEMVKQGYPREEVGTFFISPCAAKYTSVKHLLGIDKTHVDGVISIADIYGPLLNAIDNCKEEVPHNQQSGSAGIGWAVIGGESRLLKNKRILAVDGLTNVSRVLDDVVMGKLKDVDFIEGLACVGGCVGGPLTVENPFMAKARLKELSGPEIPPLPKIPQDVNPENFIWKEKIEPLNVLQLDQNMVMALQKLESMDNIHKSLPGLDCGACGAPTCRALAEDIVRGHADYVDCIFKLREKITEMAEEMVGLSRKLPHSIKKGNS